MSAPRLLAIETSSAVGSVALGIGNDVTETTIATPREQTANVLGIVDRLLTDAGLTIGGLDALIFGRGPGSFTGLRVAAAVAQGLSLASGCPIITVSSLAALAQRGFDEFADDSAGPRSEDGAIAQPERALCCVDARMGEVYWGWFQRVDGFAVADGAEQIGRPAGLIESIRSRLSPPESASAKSPGLDESAIASGLLTLGDGFVAYSQELEAVVAVALGHDATLAPRAPELIALGQVEFEHGRFVPLDAALPVYLRGADAWT